MIDLAWLRKPMWSTLASKRLVKREAGGHKVLGGNFGIALDHCRQSTPLARDRLDRL